MPLKKAKKKDDQFQPTNAETKLLVYDSHLPRALLKFRFTM